MKKTCARLRIEEDAVADLFWRCGKEEKPRLYIRHLAAKARFSRAAAAYWLGKDEAGIGRFWNAQASRFEAMIDAAKTMREYLED